METWKNISDYEGLYQVSDQGRVRSNLRSSIKILIPNNQTRGYCFVCLCKDGQKPKKFLIHRLVGISFIPNPENKPQINHKNFNKKDNSVENLEWCTQSENLIHRHYTYKGNRRVVQIDALGKINFIYDCLTHVKRGGYDKTAVRRCCTGKGISHRGYKWSYSYT